MSKHDIITRTCSACGLPKPLSAFLQISAQGTLYGNVCSTCRGAGIKEKSHTDLADEESSSSTAGSRIGAKERVHQEKEQLREIKELKEKEGKETKKRDDIRFDKAERSDVLEKSEKDRRENLIESKKSFLNYQSKPSPSVSKQSVISQRKPDSADKAFEAAQVIEKFDAEKAHEKDQQQRTTEEFASGGAVVDQPSAGMAKRENTTFRSFQIRLGGSASLGRQALSSFKAAPVKTESVTTEKTPGKDPIEQFIEDKWTKNRGPSSRR